MQRRQGVSAVCNSCRGEGIVSGNAGKGGEDRKEGESGNGNAVKAGQIDGFAEVH